MPMLECPGVFTMPLVPEGWTAIAENSLTFFELQPTSNDAAVHISVYHRREPAALEPGQAEAYLRQFVNRTPTEGEPRLVVLPPNGEEQRAFAKFRNRDDNGRVVEWFAGCILWRSTMLMCSCNAALGNPRLQEGERMIASIFQGTENNG